MSRMLQQVAAVSPSQKSDSYIYCIAPIEGGGIASITSADELVVLDRQSLSATAAVRFEGVPKPVTCMIVEQGGNEIICAGGDGHVSTHDVRLHKRTSHFKLGKPLTALTSSGHDIALGSELSNQDVLISVWDRRKNMQRWMSTENHDDITDLHFHPTNHNHLLSGGVDGLVSIFDTTIVDSDESLLQVVNHSSIHKAGFLGNNTIYALSHDEIFAIHAVSTNDNNVDPEPILLGDLRPLLGCEYAIDVNPIGKPSHIAVGVHSSNPRVELIEILGTGQLDHKKRITLAGAHGDEIVRSIFSDSQNEVLFTAGEDGQIRVFRDISNTDTVSTEGKRKSKKSIDLRYRPY